MQKVTVSAPGKLHLSGEHAVVYGNPAIVVSTSLRTTVTLEQGTGDANKQSGVLRKADKFIDEILKIFEGRYETSIPVDLAISITSGIPTGAGMGSSAALAVALFGACITFFDKQWDAQRINELAYQAEKFIHGNPSGSDPAIVTHGGILWYRKELDFLKTFWLLPFKIPKTFAPFVLINTGRTESTGDLVGIVSNDAKSDPSSFTVTLDAIEQVTKSMAQTIHDEKEQEFMEAIKRNERLLEHMSVVSLQTKSLIGDIETAGGVAKISGAGGIQTGSGVVIAMHKNPQVMLDLAKKHNYPAFQVVLGGEGVTKVQVIA